MDIVQAWAERGELMPLGKYDEVYVTSRGPTSGGGILFLHGFPGSSFDYRKTLDLLGAEVRVVAFDFPGYGLSGKPATQRFSLFEFADIAAEIVERFDIQPLTIVAHDIGDTVASEFLYRSKNGEAPPCEQAILLNGSIFIDLAELTDGQQFLLALPDEPLAEDLDLDGFRPTIRSTFSPTRQPTMQEEDALMWLVNREQGSRLLPRLIRYIDERREHQERFTQGLVDFPGDLSLLWGELDIVAVPTMVDRMLQFRPSTDVVRWPDVGHWPAMEAPDLVAGEILKRIS